jgi:hypothetical protein
VQFAEVDFTVGPHKVHLWTPGIAGTTTAVAEQDMGPGSGLLSSSAAIGQALQWHSDLQNVEDHCSIRATAEPLLHTVATEAALRS